MAHCRQLAQSNCPYGGIVKPCRRKSDRDAKECLLTEKVGPNTALGQSLLLLILDLPHLQLTPKGVNDAELAWHPLPSYPARRCLWLYSTGPLNRACFPIGAAIKLGDSQGK
jgi:hypothetical protein